MKNKTKLSISKLKTIQQLWYNLVRAVDVALTCNEKMSVYAGKEYLQLADDYKTIKSFYGSDLFHIDGKIKICITAPTEYGSVLIDYEKSQEDLESKPISIFPLENKTICSVSQTLLDLGCRKLLFSVLETELCISLAAGIAAMSCSDIIRPEHIAEAMQYVKPGYVIDVVVYAENLYTDFGVSLFQIQN